MAILSISQDLKDLRERIGRITVAHDTHGKPVTTEDLEVAGAMCAFMRESINPTVVQTIEGQPLLVHAGPFANIAIGQSSIIADHAGLKLFDYHVTESGFAADIGFEKFWNVKCRISGLTPNVSVITATIRALKMHGGGPRVAPGFSLAPEYTKENLTLLEKGIPNLLHHIRTVKMSGMKPVVCINGFSTDTKEEIALVKKYAESEGARFALSEAWLKGGEGALELADAVIDACAEKVEFKFLYPLEMPLRERVELIATNIYGANSILWIPEAEAKLNKLQADPGKKDYFTMMVKTHLSLSHDPELKGVPTGWRLPVRDILVFTGAKFLCPVTGDISLMPGTGSDPAFRRIDVDTETGRVTGLF
jgi:formate--tetrahydrofolate ligase